MLTLTPAHADSLMLEALREAEAAGARGEVPVGCVISLNGAIIARGSNTTETDKHVCAHAELHAIRAASAVVGDWRLTECVLCVTLEPCTMCLGAIRLARIPVIIFGAGDSRQGAAGSLFDLSADERLGPPPRVIRGVKREECEMVLKRFFEQLRPGR